MFGYLDIRRFASWNNGQRRKRSNKRRKTEKNLLVENMRKETRYTIYSISLIYLLVLLNPKGISSLVQLLEQCKNPYLRQFFKILCF